jgi:hypothetical protein
MPEGRLPSDTVPERPALPFRTVLVRLETGAVDAARDSGVVVT